MRIPIFFDHGPDGASLVVVREVVAVDLDAKGGVDERRRRCRVAERDAALLNQQDPHLVLGLSPAGPGRRACPAKQGKLSIDSTCLPRLSRASPADLLELGILGDENRLGKEAELHARDLNVGPVPHGREYLALGLVGRLSENRVDVCQDACLEVLLLIP